MDFLPQRTESNQTTPKTIIQKKTNISTHSSTVFPPLYLQRSQASYIPLHLLIHYAKQQRLN